VTGTIVAFFVLMLGKVALDWKAAVKPTGPSPTEEDKWASLRATRQETSNP
jgi:hypothetical protein